jgi:hypothetical protein
LREPFEIPELCERNKGLLKQKLVVEETGRRSRLRDAGASMSPRAFKYYARNSEADSDYLIWVDWGVPGGRVTRRWKKKWQVSKQALSRH